MNLFTRDLTCDRSSVTRLNFALTTRSSSRLLLFLYRFSHKFICIKAICINCLKCYC